MIEGSVLFKNPQQVSGKERKAIPVCEEFWKQPRLSNGSKDKYTMANTEATKLNLSTRPISPQELLYGPYFCR